MIAPNTWYNNVLHYAQCHVIIMQSYIRVVLSRLHHTLTTGRKEIGKGRQVNTTLPTKQV